MNKIIIGIAALVVIVIVVGGYLLLNKSETPVLPTPAEVATITERAATPVAPAAPVAEQFVIHYSDVGYSPNPLRVPVGATVVFKNESSRTMWPASAMHPTHAEYPTVGGCFGSTFDACRGVQLGDAWSFKFDIVGSWKYHDHLKPSVYGVVVVE